jgi:hypothetical protein
LVRITLKGFTKEWEVFMKCMVGCEHLPDWRRPWDDFSQEDTQEGYHRSGKKEDRDEENVSLAAKSKKKGNSGRDLSKVTCYYCNQLGNVASQCPKRKNKSKEQEETDTTTTSTMEEFYSKYDKEFYLVTLVSSIGSGGFGGDFIWIVDSGASFHMTGIWRGFLIITKIGPDRLVESEGCMAQDVCRVGRVRF